MRGSTGLSRTPAGCFAPRSSCLSSVLPPPPPLPLFFSLFLPRRFPSLCLPRQRLRVRKRVSLTCERRANKTDRTNERIYRAITQLKSSSVVCQRVVGRKSGARGNASPRFREKSWSNCNKFANYGREKRACTRNYFITLSLSSRFFFLFSLYACRMMQNVMYFLVEAE